MLINRADVYRYMGYKDSEPDASARAECDRIEELMLAEVKPCKVWRLFDLEKDGNSLRLSGCDFALEGSEISRHLENCEKAAVIAVTLGTAADRFLKKTALPGGFSGLCADALASAFTEAALDEARNEIIHETKMYSTWCFAPGYGDFPLETASGLLSAVDAARRIGLSMTGSGMLSPQKSIVGIAGLSPQQLPEHRRSCSQCGLRGVCEFRRQGGYCK